MIEKGAIDQLYMCMHWGRLTLSIHKYQINNIFFFCFCTWIMWLDDLIRFNSKTKIDIFRLKTEENCLHNVLLVFVKNRIELNEKKTTNQMDQTQKTLFHGNKYC